jgi:uncharacterized protein
MSSIAVPVTPALTAPPLQRFNARNFLVQAMLLYLAWGVVRAICLRLFAGPQLAEPLLSSVGRLGLYLSLGWLVLHQIQRSKLKLPLLLGRWPLEANRSRLVGLVVILFLFSLGSSLVSLTVESWVMPEAIEATLQETSVGALPSSLWLARLLDALVLLVIVPVVEELVFRGLLLQRWALRWGIRPALLASSLLFGCLHRNVNVIGLTMFGLVMGLLYLKTRSLWVPILCHGINNAMVVVLELLIDEFGNPGLPSLGDLRGSFGWGLLLVAVTLPLLVNFVQRNWPRVHRAVPYHQKIR